MKNDPVVMVHRDDVEWWNAPLPRRFHRCTPWTWGLVNGQVVERCACGGMRVEMLRWWMQKNSRRRTE